jgi:Na+/glutamate symporter
MALAWVACIAFGLVAGILAGGWSANAFSKRTRQIRRESRDLFLWLDSLHKRCIEARDVEPFAGWMADEITKQLTKD